MPVGPAPAPGWLAAARRRTWWRCRCRRGDLAALPESRAPAERPVGRMTTTSHTRTESRKTVLPMRAGARCGQPENAIRGCADSGRPRDAESWRHGRDTQENGADRRDELHPDQLRRAADGLRFATTADVPPLRGTVGQRRAYMALGYGLDASEAGLNVFVAGIPGYGRRTMVSDYVERRRGARAVPGDWVYVHDFAEPDHPKALQVPGGGGKRARADGCRTSSPPRCGRSRARSRPTSTTAGSGRSWRM